MMHFAFLVLSSNMLHKFSRVFVVVSGFSYDVLVLRFLTPFTLHAWSQAQPETKEILNPKSRNPKSLKSSTLESENQIMS